MLLDQLWPHFRLLQREFQYSRDGLHLSVHLSRRAAVVGLHRQVHRTRLRLHRGWAPLPDGLQPVAASSATVAAAAVAAPSAVAAAAAAALAAATGAAAAAAACRSRNGAAGISPRRSEDVANFGN